MALYNDSDSDSDTEMFTNGHQRLTRNSNFTLRPAMYEEAEKAELVYTKDIRKFNPYNIMFDDNESVGSALDIPKRVKQSTNMDEVDSDNDFEPTMTRKNVVIATDDDIEHFLDGNPAGQKEDIDGELDEYGSASASEAEEEGGGSVSEEGEAVYAPRPINKEDSAKLLELSKKYSGRGKGKEGAKAQVRSVLEKVRSAKSKVRGAPVKVAKIEGTVKLRDAKEILAPLAPVVAPKEEAKEEAKAEEKAKAKEEAPVGFKAEIEAKEADLKILEAKPRPADADEAKALKTAITNLKRMITRMKSQYNSPLLFRYLHIEEREVGKGKGSKKIYFNDVEITPVKMTLVKMKEALAEAKNAPADKARTRVISKITRAIADRTKRDTATGNPDAIGQIVKAPKAVAPPAPKANVGGASSAPPAPAKKRTVIRLGGSKGGVAAGGGSAKK